MSVTARDFFESAKTLALANDEMSQRNSMSRAYYAAFHQSSQTIPPIKRPENGTGMHKSYIDQLIEHEPNSLERILGVALQTLHARRIRADYRLNDPFPVNAVAMQLSAADKLFDLLEPKES